MRAHSLLPTGRRSGALRVTGLGLVLTLALAGCSGASGDPSGSSTSLRLGTKPVTTTSTALTTSLDRLGAQITAISADTTLRDAATASKAADSDLQRTMITVKDTLKKAQAFHKSSPQDCTGLQQDVSALTTVTDQATAQAGLAGTSAMTVGTAASALAAALKGVAPTVEASQALASAGTTAELQRLESYTVALQALTGSQLSNAASAISSKAAADSATKSVATQASVGAAMMTTCTTQQAARDAKKAANIAKLRAEAEAAAAARKKAKQPTS